MYTKKVINSDSHSKFSFTDLSESGWYDSS